MLHMALFFVFYVPWTVIVGTIAEEPGNIFNFNTAKYDIVAIFLSG